MTNERMKEGKKLDGKKKERTHIHTHTVERNFLHRSKNSFMDFSSVCLFYAMWCFLQFTKHRNKVQCNSRWCLKMLRCSATQLSYGSWVRLMKLQWQGSRARNTRKYVFLSSTSLALLLSFLFSLSLSLSYTHIHSISLTLSLVLFSTFHLCSPFLINYMVATSKITTNDSISQQLTTVEETCPNNEEKSMKWNYTTENLVTVHVYMYQQIHNLLVFTD